MDGRKGNLNALKLKTRALRKIAYEQYCAHIASGLPEKAWHLEGCKSSICYKTMKSYLAMFEEEFDLEELEIAEAKSFKSLFEDGLKIMRGEYRYSSPVVWQTIMRNMFKKHGWDAIETSGPFSPEAWNGLKKFFKDSGLSKPLKTQDGC